MALVDENRDVLVLRIVYDGPAFSGKTSSVRALAAGVGRAVTTPSEHEGRTLFFDWVDYVGGMFEGRQIRCQIVSAPGQLELQRRREALLVSADAVVAVLDSRRRDWPFSLEWAKSLVSWCRGHEPPVGLVVQANKRDAADAVPLSELRPALTSLVGTRALPVVESSATNNEGIRETFVLAVGLALDRVRALGGSKRLHSGIPPQDTPEQLLSLLSDPNVLAASADPNLVEQFAVPTAASPKERVTARARVPATEELDLVQVEEATFEPDVAAIPSGRIWPPVDGRALLHEVATLKLRARRTARGDWSGSGSGFRFHSTREAIYSDTARGRQELLEWARDHASNVGLISPGRAVLLADAGAGRERLWQLVRTDVTLREHLAGLATTIEAESLARELVEVADKLLSAREQFARAAVNLVCSLWTVSADRALYAGLMPTRARPPPTEPQGNELVARELSSHVRSLRRTRVDYDLVTREVATLAARGVAGACALADLFADS